MSEGCPQCRCHGMHFQLRIGRDGKVIVEHWCEQHDEFWDEDARDPEGALASFGWPRLVMGIERPVGAQPGPSGTEFDGGVQHGG